MAHHSAHIKILNHAKSFDVCNKHQYEIYKVSLFSPVVRKYKKGDISKDEKP